MMLYVCVLLIVILSVVQGLEKDQSCTTPANINGKCIPLQDCPTIVDKLRLKGNEGINLAQESHCGFFGMSPMVCCEEQEIVDTLDITDDDFECGLSISDRLIGGTITQLAEYPWIVALEYKSKASGDNAGIRCVGTIINNRYVLTAAECLLDEKFELVSVRLGEWNISADPDCSTFAVEDCLDPVQNSTAEDIITHPNYNKTDGSNDIGLIRLDEDIVFSDSIKSICLPSRNSEPKPENSRVHVAGWGTPEYISSELKHYTARTQSEAECKNTTQEIALNAQEFCVKKPSNLDSCVDSMGSPVMDVVLVPSIGVHFAIEGMITRVMTQCNEFDFALYTRIADYVPWILKTIKK